MHGALLRTPCERGKLKKALDRGQETCQSSWSGLPSQPYYLAADPANDMIYWKGVDSMIYRAPDDGSGAASVVTATGSNNGLTLGP